ncbi:MAG: hypothetical protein LBH00_01265 [Planctomycetaceae bacterium]|jgi:hypothetical protein|nr:hypothetical protein [Planctomycetaceae bacterium]
MSAIRLVNRLSAILLSAAAGMLCASGGCRSLPSSGFDPNGERLFEKRPFADCPLFSRRTESPTTVTATPPINPGDNVPGAINGDGASIYSPPNALPGDFGAAKTNPGVPNYTSTATPLPPNAHAVKTALILNPEVNGERTPPRSWEAVFNETGGYALPTVPVTGPALMITPREQIAPIGSEIVLIASYLGNKDRLVTNEKIEWSLEGSGTIEKFDPGSCCDPLVFDCIKAKKLTDRYAVTKTSRVYQTLDRGTPDTADDIHLLRGQTWISVNSMKEGTTCVTAFAPNMADWSKRTDAGIIHWVDAQWVLPRLSIAPVGESRVLTTTVLRATNGQPRKGWIVRYEILNGPAAGFGPSSAQIEEIETDMSGQATVILNPKEQQSGANTIGIQIIRPAGTDGVNRRVTVGSEQVRQTWSGNPNIVLNIKGPNEAKPGQELPYEITVTNRTSSGVQGAVLLPVPPLASYIRSQPPGQMQGQTVMWNVHLAPNSTETIRVTLRQGAAGSLWLRPEFRRGTDSGQPATGTSTAPPVHTPPVHTPPPNNNPPRHPSPPSAEVFPGANTSPVPPVTLPPELNPNPPAATFRKPSLNLRIAADPEKPLERGKALYFFVYVENTGTAEAKDVEVRMPIPPELRGQTILAEARPKNMAKCGLDPLDNNIAVLRVPLLAAKETAHMRLQYPVIEQQGYTMTAEVFAGQERIGQTSQRITPP